MTVRAVRGAIQVERDEPDVLRSRVALLITEILRANGLEPDDLISMIFTATSDLVSAFPAEAARELGLVDVPLMCARELDVEGGLPRTVRILAHAETDRRQADVRHVYLGGAAVLRPDLARPGGGTAPGSPGTGG
ncbi:chorismate mutase [Streptomyces thermolineatus]|uniref:chorismate mutase n=1 Tax=Streptomyces thermolineatus TaxID=44033 RepID=A0ABP5ZX17_9ACTN|nr:chorismate mutase [Streptomyces sp. HB2AG]MCZ2523082.1 chorismate mutase [Streptomyces sp. HB2AG]